MVLRALCYLHFDLVDEQVGALLAQLLGQVQSAQLGADHLLLADGQVRDEAKLALQRSRLLVRFGLLGRMLDSFFFSFFFFLLLAAGVGLVRLPLAVILQLLPPVLRLSVIASVIALTHHRQDRTTVLVSATTTTTTTAAVAAAAAACCQQAHLERVLDASRAVQVEHEAVERELVVDNGRVDADRCRAAALELGQEGALGNAAQQRVLVVQPIDHRDHLDVGAATLDAQGALAHGVHADRGRQDLRDPIVVLHALEAGSGQNDGVELGLEGVVQLGEACLQVAAYGLELERRVLGLELRDASQRARADHAVGVEVGERVLDALPALGHDERVARVFARRHAAYGQRVGQLLARHVLERVHDQVDVVRLERVLELLGEEALVADLLQRHVEYLVALGIEVDDLERALRIQALHLLGNAAFAFAEKLIFIRLFVICFIFRFTRYTYNSVWTMASLLLREPILKCVRLRGQFCGSASASA